MCVLSEAVGLVSVGLPLGPLLGLLLGLPLSLGPAPALMPPLGSGVTAPDQVIGSNAWVGRKPHVEVEPGSNVVTIRRVSWFSFPCLSARRVAAAARLDNAHSDAKSMDVLVWRAA